jgi:hypothetical protein
MVAFVAVGAASASVPPGATAVHPEWRKAFALIDIPYVGILMTYPSSSSLEPHGVSEPLTDWVASSGTGQVSQNLSSARLKPTFKRQLQLLTLLLRTTTKTRLWRRTGARAAGARTIHAYCRSRNRWIPTVCSAVGDVLAVRADSNGKWKGAAAEPI